jgi:hypothetical protein
MRYREDIKARYAQDTSISSGGGCAWERDSVRRQVVILAFLRKRFFFLYQG